MLRGLSTGFGLFPVLIHVVRRTSTTGRIAIQAHAAKLHGGTVEVADTSSGCTMRLTLPAHLPAHQRAVPDAGTGAHHRPQEVPR